MSRRKLSRFEAILMGLEINFKNSADSVNGAGGGGEGPGERGCLEGGRGGEQASGAGCFDNANNKCVDTDI